MRTRAPAEVAHPRPADVEAVGIGDRTLVSIGRTVEEDYAGLRWKRNAGNCHFSGEVAREALGGGVPAYPFFDCRIDQAQVLAHRLAALWMQPKCVHEVGEEVVDRSAPGQKHRHHVGDDLFLRQVRALLAGGDEHGEKVVAARVLALAQFGIEKIPHIGSHGSRKRTAHRTLGGMKQADHQFAAPLRRLFVESEHPAQGAVQQRSPEVGDEVAAAATAELCELALRMVADSGLHRVDAPRRKTLEHDAPQLVMARRIDGAERLPDAHRRVDRAVTPRRGEGCRIGERPAYVLEAGDQPEAGLLHAVNRMTVPHLFIGRIRVPHEGPVMRIEPESHGYCPDLRVPSFISFAPLSASSRITCAKSSGEPGRISSPMLSNLATTSGSASAPRASALSFATIVAGGLAAATKPPQGPTT